jgi:hypothetical protein
MFTSRYVSVLNGLRIDGAFERGQAPKTVMFENLPMNLICAPGAGNGHLAVTLLGLFPLRRLAVHDVLYFRVEHDIDAA